MIQSAFDKLETTEEQIRAVEIAVVALIASQPCGSNLQTLVDEIRVNVLRLVDLPRVLSDARHQLGGFSEKVLDLKERRENRIRKVIMVFVHVEGFAASNGLEPIILSTKTFKEGEVTQHLSCESIEQFQYPVSALLKTGIFHGAKTANELLAIEDGFSDRELAVLAGLLEEGVPRLPDGSRRTIFADEQARAQASEALKAAVAAGAAQNLESAIAAAEACGATDGLDAAKDALAKAQRREAAKAAEDEEKAKREKAESERKAAAEAEAKAAAAAEKRKEKEERERAEVERKAAAEALKKTQQGTTLAPTEARAAARAALGVQKRSELDKELHDECNKWSKDNRGKVKGMLDRGADPNGYKVRRT